MRVTAVDIYMKSIWSKGKGRAAGLMVCTTRNGMDKKKMVVVESEESKSRMHLELVDKVLGMLAYECTVGIYIEDLMLRNAVENEWWKKWQQNDWKKASGKDVANKDIWESIAPKLELHEVGICRYINTHDKELSEVLEKENGYGKEKHESCTGATI